MSIHPRVVNGRQAHPKVNTAKRSRNKLQPKKKANMIKHLEQHPNDAATRARIDRDDKASGN